jgi:hypothetical protein
MFKQKKITMVEEIPDDIIDIAEQCYDYDRLREIILINPEYYTKYLDLFVDNSDEKYTYDNFLDLIKTFGFNINASGNYRNDGLIPVKPILSFTEYQKYKYIKIFCKLGCRLNDNTFIDCNNLIVSSILGHGANWIYNKELVIKCVEQLIKYGCNYDNNFNFESYVDYHEVLEYYEDNDLITSILKNEYNIPMIKSATKQY